MNNLDQNTLRKLQSLSYDCLLDLATTEGINASARNEAYGCIFGRDSAITLLKILNVYLKSPQPELLEVSRRTLLTLINLQGKEVNVESGEEPGKFIHEFRRDKYEKLINREKPWFIYSDKTLRNYDSVDSTPLGLIALYKYWQVIKDKEFYSLAFPAVKAGIDWLMSMTSKDNDSFIEYEVPESRIYGGLPVQSWTDSYHSLLTREGLLPKYPIAAVEVQAFTWLALKLWGDHYSDIDPGLGKKLNARATTMKKNFTRAFLLKDHGLYFAAQALDGNKKQITTITGNPLLCLWATYDGKNGRECIIDEKYIPDFVSRAFLPDLFDPDAGIRTMSSLAHSFNPGANSYHNGSFWPMLNGLIHEGLMRWHYTEEAELLFHASLKPIQYFGCPIELYIKNDDTDNYIEYTSDYGKKGCRYQAWSAAAVLDFVTHGEASVTPTPHN